MPFGHSIFSNLHSRYKRKREREEKTTTTKTLTHTKETNYEMGKKREYYTILLTVMLQDVH